MEKKTPLVLHQTLLFTVIGLPCLWALWMTQNSCPSNSCLFFAGDGLWDVSLLDHGIRRRGDLWWGIASLGNKRIKCLFGKMRHEAGNDWHVIATGVLIGNQGNWTDWTKESPKRGENRRVATEFYSCASIGEARGNSW